VTEPEFTSDGIEPGRDVSGDQFALMMQRIEEAADDYLMTAPSGNRQDVINAFMMFLSHWIALTHKINERDTWLTICRTVTDHVKLHRGTK
jgi:hypothetical protein